MRSGFLLLIAVMMISAMFQTKPSKEAALKSMVETERAFAKASETNGTREAFAAFIAEDGILFRPTAVNGKRWLRENPPPASDKRPLLAWEPSFADISAAGDMGYTFGPWKFKPDIKDAKPSAFGHFLTVWRKQGDGTWKFVVDLGISHAEHQSVAQLKLAKLSAEGKELSAAEINARREALTKADWVLGSDLGAKGVAKTIEEHGGEGLVVFRSDHFPLSDRKAAMKVLEASKGTWKSQPDFAEISRSGDLGYTFGTYEAQNDSGQAIAKGNYLRIWKRHENKWKLVVDLQDPQPV